MNVVTIRLWVRRMLKYAAHRILGEGGAFLDLGYIQRVTGTVERRRKGL
jgi:hypothetical protein